MLIVFFSPPPPSPYKNLFVQCTFHHFCQGVHNIEQDVFLSLPCVVGSNGITDVILQTLSDEEKAKLQNSASALNDVQTGIVI